jgi:hypothetical protein
LTTTPKSHHKGRSAIVQEVAPGLYEISQALSGFNGPICSHSSYQHRRIEPLPNISDVNRTPFYPHATVGQCWGKARFLTLRIDNLISRCRMAGCFPPRVLCLPFPPQAVCYSTTSSDILLKEIPMNLSSNSIAMPPDDAHSAFKEVYNVFEIYRKEIAI